MINRIDLTRAGLIALTLLVAAPPAVAEEDGGKPLFEQGRGIFENNCAVCHQSSGAGLPPNIPALKDNERLSDLALIVERVSTGKGGMPAFPDLEPNQIAAVADYIRNAWTNAFGPVSTAEVEDLLPTVSRVEADRTIWDGVYTQSQADGARLIYLGSCASCHGRRLNGAPDNPDMSSGPPLAGRTFLREWDGRSLAALFEFVRSTMPVRNPGQFKDQQYIDIIAYMLSYGGAPAGNETLPPDLDALSTILIVREPE